MSTDSIEALIQAEVEKRVAAQTVEVLPETSIYQVGATLLVRTVTHYAVGRVCYVGDDEIGMVEASWVADTGRFSAALEKGELSEVEPVGWRMSIGRGAIVDAFLWCHPLPRDRK
jgi:hypothetical protein